MTWIKCVAKLFLRRRLLLVRVSGSSMEPTYTSGDIVVCELRPIVRTLMVGDVVILSTPSDRGTLSIKRLAGTPGDSVGEATSRQVLRAGQFWVLGDNPRIVGDSRRFGAYLAEHIVARAIHPRPKSAGAIQP